MYTSDASFLSLFWLTYLTLKTPQRLKWWNMIDSVHDKPWAILRADFGILCRWILQGETKDYQQIMSYPPWNKHSPWKLMVGKLVSFWDGFLAGAMLVSGRIYVCCLLFVWVTNWYSYSRSVNSAFGFWYLQKHISIFSHGFTIWFR